MKTLEYRKDEITAQFIDNDNVVIRTSHPGMPLMVRESNDEDNYFDINTKLYYFCEGNGAFKTKQGELEGHFVKQSQVVRVMLDKYEYPE